MRLIKGLTGWIFFSSDWIMFSNKYYFPKCGWKTILPPRNTSPHTSPRTEKGQMLTPAFPLAEALMTRAFPGTTLTFVMLADCSWRRPVKFLCNRRENKLWQTWSHIRPDFHGDAYKPFSLGSDLWHFLRLGKHADRCVAVDVKGKTIYIECCFLLSLSGQSWKQA